MKDMSEKTPSATSEAEKALKKAIDDLGVKWNFRSEAGALVRDSCLTKDPDWMNDLKAIQKFLIAVLCLLLCPIFIGGLSVFWESEYRWKLFLRTLLDDQECLVKPFKAVTLASKPLANCYSVCQGLEHMEVVENLTPDEFQSNYAYSGRPVLIKGKRKGTRKVTP